MNNQKALELITNSFIAASKIRELQTPKNTRGTQTGDRVNNIGVNNIGLIFDILQVVSDYSPGKYRQPLSHATRQSRRYVETLFNLHQHINNLEKPRLKSQNIINTLNIIRPILGTNEAQIAQKIIKIYEVLNS